MDALCASIRTEHCKDMRPVTMRPRYRYLTADAVLTVLGDFSKLFVAQSDPRELGDIVKRCSGRILSLGGPSGWFLYLQTETQIEDFPGHPRWDEYPGTPKGQYVLLGQCIKKSRFGGPYTELRWFMYMGPHGQILCYHEPSDAIFVVALSIDELARRGLVNCEFMYEGPHLPQTTTVPARLVNELMNLDCKDGKALSDYAKRRRGRVMLLHTPGEGERPLALCGSDRCLRLWWPFSAMDDVSFSRFIDRIDARFKTNGKMWMHFAVVGLRVGNDPFRVESIIITDELGAMYHVDPDYDMIWRIADSVHMLLKMGLTKVYMPKRRLDKKSVAIGRMEAPGCAHVADAAWIEYYDIYGAKVRRDHAQQLEWLMRENRFNESTGTWDETDSSMRKTFDSEAKDAIRRDVEVADSLNDVEYTIRGCQRETVDDPTATIAAKLSLVDSDD